MIPVASVGIVGAGTMGSRIGFRCAFRGKQVRLYDVSPEALEGAIARIREWVTDRVSEGKLQPQEAESVLRRIHVCRDLNECVTGVDLVIEAVPERLELKQEMFKKIDRLTSADTLIASSTSSIVPSLLASVTSRPEKVFCMNFTDPSSDEDRLVELMMCEKMTEEVKEAAVHFVKSLGMVPIVTKKEIMGFTLNRIWRAIKKECLRLVAEGYADFEDIDRAWMLVFKTPIGPFGKMDWIGLDVVYDIEMQYYRASGDESDKPPQFLADMIAQGRLGIKSGRGFYEYPNPAYERPEWLEGQDP